MEATTITATIWSDTYSLRANWGDAASAIERETEGGWEPTGMQVADYRHSSEDAMRAELEAAVVASGDDVDDADTAAEIDAALAGIV